MTAELDVEGDIGRDFWIHEASAVSPGAKSGPEGSALGRAALRAAVEPSGPVGDDPEAFRHRRTAVSLGHCRRSAGLDPVDTSLGRIRSRAPRRSALVVWSSLRSREARVTKPEKRPRGPQHRRCRDSCERESRPGSLAAIFRTRLMATAKAIIFALPGFRISPGTFGGACAKPGRADARVPRRSRKRRTLTT